MSTRSELWKMRKTWNGIFTPRLIRDLDEELHSIDPAYPTISKNAEKELKKVGRFVIFNNYRCI